MEALEDGDGFLRPGVPDVHLRLGSNLSRGDDILVLRVLVDTQTDDVIGVLQVEALIGWNGKHTANEKIVIYV